MRCVYCLAEVESKQITNDHVIARAWYPKSTPQNIEKWKVPACWRCNNNYGRLEQEVLLRLAMCLDRNDPAAAGIVDNAFRSVDPAAVTSAKEKRIRLARRSKLIADTKQLDSIPDRAILPSFRKNFDIGSRTGILIPAKDLNAVVEKWARGFDYVLPILTWIHALSSKYIMLTMQLLPKRMTPL